MKHYGYSFRRRRMLYKNLILIVLTAFIWILGGIYITLIKEERSLAVQQNLANQVVRFHVLADSNSSVDQALKLLVKNAVLEYMSEPLARCESASEALDTLDRNTHNIIRIARQVLEENGYSYPVAAGIEEVYFPVKSYGDVTFPAGMYTAYRIIIGEGKGNNWWCVLYPPLCFLDITHGVVPEESREQLRSVLTEEEYLAITETPTDGSLLFDTSENPHEVYLRFRILTFLNP